LAGLRIVIVRGLDDQFGGFLNDVHRYQPVQKTSVPYLLQCYLPQCIQRCRHKSVVVKERSCRRKGSVCSGPQARNRKVPGPIKTSACCRMRVPYPCLASPSSSPCPP
jgi:hypothetical protein